MRQKNAGALKGLRVLSPTAGVEGRHDRNEWFWSLQMEQDGKHCGNDQDREGENECDE